MRILVLGSGAREHAMSWKLRQEPNVDYVLCAPGNAGIARSMNTASVDPSDTAAVVGLVKRERIDLTVIGSEGPLSHGLADRLVADGRLVLGPSRAAARLETSKAFAKDFMRRHHVPTARYSVCESVETALAALRSGEFGEALVVKADGLAAGKGVVVAADRQSAEAAVRAAMVDRSFGDAGARVVIEEMLDGPELSYFVVADGEDYVPLLSAQDHKRLLDDDRGPNTGGMGAFAPSTLIDDRLRHRIEREIVQPVLRGMVGEGTPFRGFLYCGVMLTADGPKVIEFNVRFGDPEAQVVMPLLGQPLAPLLLAAAEGKLRPRAEATSPMAETSQVASGFSRTCVGVVLAAHGYPGTVRSGDVITGLDETAAGDPDVMVFHAGVRQRDSALVTAGGRVLTVVATAASYESAIAKAYAAAAQIHFEGMQFRSDIGRKAVVAR